MFLLGTTWSEEREGGRRTSRVVHESLETGLSGRRSGHDAQSILILSREGDPSCGMMLVVGTVVFCSRPAQV